MPYIFLRETLVRSPQNWVWYLFLLSSLSLLSLPVNVNKSCLTPFMAPQGTAARQSLNLTHLWFA